MLGVTIGVGTTFVIRPAPSAVVDPSEPVPVQRAPTSPTPVQLGDDDPLPERAIPELATMNDLFQEVADRVKASVVFINVEARPERRAAAGEDMQAYEELMRRYRSSSGSGVIVSREGFVVTNNHVVEGASRIRVMLDDRREYDAEIVGTDPTTDLAVIRLLGHRADDGPLPVATLGDSDAVRVGELVLAVGNPFRLTSTVTFGIVSALGRQVDIIQDDFRIEDFIQTDAAINQGNSGGPLVNMRGEVIGVATAIATDDATGVSQGYGFAVPVNLVRRVVEDLITIGEVRRGYLGVELRPVTAADANQFGMTRIGGVLISNIAARGGAARVGLRRDDILLSVDGFPVDAPNQFTSRLALRRPGDDVELEIYRGGETRRVRATLIGRDDASFQQWIADLGTRRVEPPPPDPGDPPPSAFFEAEAWGIGLRDLTGRERRAFGVPGGAYVAFVDPGSVAAAGGLPIGAVITQVEGQDVTTAEEARTALSNTARSGIDALVRIRREDGLIAFYDLETPYQEVFYQE
ncbi:trypsin-like peptidase domain-containing protein [soil metagenome]